MNVERIPCDAAGYGHAGQARVALKACVLPRQMVEPLIELLPFAHQERRLAELAQAGLLQAGLDE